MNFQLMMTIFSKSFVSFSFEKWPKNINMFLLFCFIISFCQSQPNSLILLLIEVHWEDIPEEKTNVFIKSPHLGLARQDFKEAKLSNCFSADSLPVQSAQCLRLSDLQTELKLSTKPLLKFYCAPLDW